ncbi:hypothetical protein [Salinisphaera sp. LB1]|uniref:hypothetical protein n=1 Tax=Salinisphaera sp. LB1 TaxID=2183911 RepID=UPI000D7D60B8|nr:hypothetical protein [Salinisphaera sp. LB1]AWN15357.1 hypothetical protein SALB1_1150 [Salinisphaera sp. LB1]
MFQATLGSSRRFIPPGGDFAIALAVCDPDGDDSGTSLEYSVSVNGITSISDRSVGTLPFHTSLSRHDLLNGLPTYIQDALNRSETIINVQASLYVPGELPFPGPGGGRRIYLLEGWSNTVHIQVGEPGSLEDIHFLDQHGDIIHHAANWNEPYFLAFSVPNPENSPVTYELTVSEQDVGGDGTWTPIVSGPEAIHLEPRSSGVHRVRISKKDWHWMTAEIVTGPESKRYRYRVEVSGHDAYGNPLTSAPREAMIHVRVPDHKWVWGFSAVAQLGWSVTDLALSFIPFLRWTAITAAVHEISAAAMEAIAEDPPDPDKEYSKPTKPDLPASLSGVPSAFVHYTALAEITREIAVRRQHLFAVEAKILGAIEAKDTKAEKKLVEQYANELGQIGKRYREMVDHLEPAMKEHVSAGTFDPANTAKVVAAAALREMGSPLLKKNLPNSDFAEIAKKIHELENQLDASSKQLAITVPDLQPAPENIAQTMRKAVLMLGRAIQATVSDSMGRYLLINPEYFGGKPQSEKQALTPFTMVDFPNEVITRLDTKPPAKAKS